MNSFLVSLSICLMICLSSFKIAEGGEPPVRQAELTRLLDQASAEVGDAFPEIPGQLTLSPAFTAVWKNAGAYRDVALPVLSGADIDERKKLILAYAIQALCLQDLLELDRQALMYWKRGAISTAVLDTLLFPVYDWNTIIQQNYRNPEVTALLRKIQQEQVYAQNAARASYVAEVISGQAAKDIERLRRDGQLERRESRLNCE